jgi:hypothetical protein
MSTIFSVKVVERDQMIQVAYRNNSGEFSWLSTLAILLPDDTEVIAIDNTPQGILTIGDIRKKIKGNGEIR